MANLPTRYNFVFDENIDIKTIYAMIHDINPDILSRVQHMCANNPNLTDHDIRLCIIKSLKTISTNIERAIFQKGDIIKQNKRIQQKQQQQRRQQQQQQANQQQNRIFDSVSYKAQVQSLERELYYLKNFYTRAMINTQAELSAENARLKLNLNEQINTKNNQLVKTIERNEMVINQLQQELEVCRKHREDCANQINSLAVQFKQHAKINDPNLQPNRVFELFIEKYKTLVLAKDRYERQSKLMTDRLTRNTDTLQKRLKRLNAKKRNTDITTQTRIRHLKRTTNTLKNQLDECVKQKNQLELLKQQHDTSLDDSVSLRAKIESLQSEIQRLTQTNVNQSTQINQLTQTDNEKSMRIDQLTQADNEKSMQIQQLMKKISDQAMEIDQITQQTADKSQEIDQMINNNAYQVGELKKLLNDCNNELQIKTTQVKELDIAIKQQQENINKTHSSVDDTIKKLKDLNAGNNDNDDDDKDLNKIINNIQTTFTVYKRLFDNINNAVAYYENLRNSLSLNEDNERQVYTFVLDVLTNIKTDKAFKNYTPILDFDSIHSLDSTPLMVQQPPMFMSTPNTTSPYAPFPHELTDIPVTNLLPALDSSALSDVINTYSYDKFYDASDSPSAATTTTTTTTNEIITSNQTATTTTTNTVAIPQSRKRTTNTTYDDNDDDDNNDNVSSSSVVPVSTTSKLKRRNRDKTLSSALRDAAPNTYVDTIKDNDTIILSDDDDEKMNVTTEDTSGYVSINYENLSSVERSQIEENQTAVKNLLLSENISSVATEEQDDYDTDVPDSEYDANQSIKANTIVTIDSDSDV